VKLAHSLSSKEFATLTIYYQNLLWAEAAILGNKETEKKVDTVGIDLDHPTLSVLYKKGQEVEDIIRNYVSDVTTDTITIGKVFSEAESLEKSEQKPQEG
jgi:hypothetical protein